MRVALLAAMISLTSAVDVKSQAALIPRPDTLGANFDAARPGKGTPQDY